MTPKLKHSPQRTQWVTGRVSEDHADIPRDKLNRIVDDALRAALIHDHGATTTHRRHGRADSAPAGGIRTDGGNPKMSTRDTKRDAAERLRARQDDAMAHLRNAHRRPSRGYTKQDAKSATVGTRPAPQPGPGSTATADDAFEALRGAHKRGK